MNYSFRITSAISSGDKNIANSIIRGGILHRIHRILSETEFSEEDFQLIIHIVANLLGTNCEYRKAVTESNVLNDILLQSRRFDRCPMINANMCWLLSNLLRCYPYMQYQDANFILQNLVECLKMIPELTQDTISELIWATYFYIVAPDDADLRIEFIIELDIADTVLQYILRDINKDTIFPILWIACKLAAHEKGIFLFNASIVEVVLNLKNRYFIVFWMVATL